MAKNWAKVAANLDSHPKVREAGNLGRQVFEFALRRNSELDLGGRIPKSYMRPGYLAEQLMLEACPHQHDGVTKCHAATVTEQAVSGLSRAVAAGLLVDQDEHFVIVGWDDEWAKRPLDEAERKRRQRVSERKDSSVTKCHDASVTQRDCPDSHGSDQIRSDQIRVDQDPPLSPKGDAEVRSKRAVKLPADWQPADTEPNRKASNDARSRGVDLAAELRNMHDWALSTGKSGKDWDARWRLWLSRAQPARTTQRSGQSFFEIVDSLPLTPPGAPS